MLTSLQAPFSKKRISLLLMQQPDVLQMKACLSADRDCDATGDAMKNKSWYRERNYRCEEKNKN
jgi:hypothetical protein